MINTFYSLVQLHISLCLGLNRPCGIQPTSIPPSSHRVFCFCDNIQFQSLIRVDDQTSLFLGQHVSKYVLFNSLNTCVLLSSLLILKNLCKICTKQYCTMIFKYDTIKYRQILLDMQYNCKCLLYQKMKLTISYPNAMCNLIYFKIVYFSAIPYIFCIGIFYIKF